MARSKKINTRRILSKFTAALGGSFNPLKKPHTFLSVDSDDTIWLRTSSQGKMFFIEHVMLYSKPEYGKQHYHFEIHKALLITPNREEAEIAYTKLMLRNGYEKSSNIPH